MANKRSQASIPAAETGAIAGDFQGSRNYTKMPQGGRTDGVKKGSHARGGALANVKQVGKGNAQGRMPLQSPPANVTGTKMSYGGHGQPPAQRGGPARLRAGGKNQTWPNGAMYTDAAKKGSSGKDSGPIATRKPARR